MRLISIGFVTALIFIFCVTVNSGYAGTIQYIASGKKDVPVAISFSRNNGASWQNAKIGPGQTVTVPPDATHLNINNAPYDPKKNLKIREGNVF